MIGVKPYISFNGNCAEAVKFYIETLGGEVLYSQTYGESPMKGMGPDNNIMHCTVKIGDTHIMACDNPEGQPASAGSNISLALGTNDVEGAVAMFEAMAAGGTVTMPIQETFWAERFGMLTDRFGINWMFNCEKSETDHAKATG